LSPYVFICITETKTCSSMKIDQLICHWSFKISSTVSANWSLKKRTDYANTISQLQELQSWSSDCIMIHVGKKLTNIIIHDQNIDCRLIDCLCRHGSPHPNSSTCPPPSSWPQRGIQITPWGRSCPYALRRCTTWKPLRTRTMRWEAAKVLVGVELAERWLRSDVRTGERPA
jgi:hypothetical protein